MVRELFDLRDDGKLLLRVHVQPGAGRTAVSGRHGDALKVRVAAPPTGGRANDACTTMLADLLGVKAAQVALQSGQSSRSKRFLVEGIEAPDAERLLSEALLAATSRPGRADREIPL